MRLNRQILIILAAAAVLLGGLGLWTFVLKKGPEPQPPVASTGSPASPTASSGSIDPATIAPRRQGEDFVVGAENAPAVIIEYASLTCPHCARFHADVLPRIKSEYVERGLVKFIYRDFPLDGAALRAAQIARCLPAERYFTFMDVLFRQQEQWAAGRDVNAIVDRVKQLAALAGLSRERAEACSTDQDLQKKIVEAAQAGERDYQIRATPTIVVNGKRHAGANSFEELEKLLAPLVKKP
ncbi:MAG: DsbA family protein [Alphaproteobacteria bacterium]|nr:DsbA family protein [Alphaproteobacteria bacterium]